MHTVDTDIIVICAGKCYDLLQQQPAADVWLTFGTGMKFRHIHINTMCNTLGLEKSTALPVFHSFSGCDTTSAFLGKEKGCQGKHGNHFPRI